MLKNISKFAAVAGMAALMLPALASAHGFDGRTTTQSTNEFGVRIFDSKDADTNVNTNSNTSVKEDTDKDEVDADVDENTNVNSNTNTDSKDTDNDRGGLFDRFTGFVRHNRDNGDKDNGWHLGQQIKGLEDNLKSAVARGTVTAVNSDGTMKLQTKDDGTSITVNTNSNTQVVDNNNDNTNTTAASDIQVGMKAKVIGFWDSVLNVFNAIKIKLF